MFHRLDVVRWERSRVDATEVATESDLLDGWPIGARRAAPF